METNNDYLFTRPFKGNFVVPDAEIPCKRANPGLSPSTVGFGVLLRELSWLSRLDDTILWKGFIVP